MRGMESDAELRRELQAAIANVRRQIDVQSGANNYNGIGFPSGRVVALRELEDELAQLEEALAGLGDANAKGP